MFQWLQLKILWWAHSLSDYTPQTLMQVANKKHWDEFSCLGLPLTHHFHLLDITHETGLA